MKHTRSSTSAAILQVRATALAVDEETLPAGVCGRVKGIAVRYDVTDSYGTIFKRGCFDKTRSKVRAGKVKLFVNHGWGDGYGPESHVGTVRSLETVGDGEFMIAELFDTEAGRKQLEYLRAVMNSNAETGLSIGFYEHEGGFETHAGKQRYVFTEVELDEISLAPRQSVPGAEVTGVRNKNVSHETRRALLCQMAQGLTRAEWLAAVEDVAPPVADEAPAPQEPTTGEDDSPTMATYADRLSAVQRSLATPSR